ncbi:ABC transporter ATP-binding protein [Roseospira marina]|uniref:ABC transporter ATP-binding protein n=1 Tax=Roseospira marina TaxID=140057 RepID=A0A5M6IBE2_9PROT|nr:ABC transporter ATP-binding protein [Roseospira marina]
MIEVANLTQDYPGLRALDAVSFSIAPGTVTALVGPNGAGKTTLLRCLAALDLPFAGRIRVAGLDATERPRAVHRMTGFLQDFFGLYDSLTVEAGLWYAAAARGVPRSAIPERIAWAAAAVGLSERLSHRAGTLSRGMRQRLATAQTIIHRPRVVLLDEPASGLDPENRADLAGLLRRLRTDYGMTLVVSSHILSELEDYSTHVMILRDGRLIRHDALGDEAGGEPGVANDRTGPARLLVSLSHPTPDAAAVLAARDDIADVTPLGEDDRRVFVTLVDGADPARRTDLLAALVAAGVPVCGFDVERRNLQDVYLDHLREPREPAGEAP